MITLDNRTLESFGYRALMEHYHEAIPNVRRKNIMIPGMSGRWDFGSELESKTFEIPIQALSDSSVSLQALQNELVAFLMDEYGNPREIKMVFDYELDKFYTVKIDGAIAPVLRAHILRNKTLPFIAHDPYKYAQSNEYDKTINYDENYLYDDGHYYPNTASVKIKNVYQYTGLYNYSHLATPLSMEIKGRLLNPEIINRTTNKFIQILIDVKDDETLYIMADNYTAYIDGPSGRKEAFTLIEGDFIDLMPGDNSLLIVSGNPNAHIDFKWKHKFN